MSDRALTTAERARPTWFARQYNRTADGWRRAAGPPAALAFEPLLDRVERRLGTRLPDNPRTAFARAAFRQGLDVTATPGRLTPFGRLVLRKTTLRNLSNLVQVENLALAPPAELGEPMPPPVVIVGLYRSGTTLLHRLLAAHPALRAPRTWELFWPVPAVPRSRRVDRRRRWRTAADLAGSRLAVPDMQDVHPLRAEGYEESLFLLESAGVMFTAWYAMAGYRHGDWLLRQDLTLAFRSLDLQLRAMGLGQGMLGEGARRRWLLKCPLTTWFLEPLLAVHPRASIIQLHRPIAQTLPSFCSMLEVLQRGGLRRRDPAAIGGFFGDAFIEGLRRAADARARHPQARVLDVDYGALTADPTGTAARVFEWLGLPPAPAAPDRAHGRAPFRSKHVYDPRDFGLDLPALEARAARWRP